MVRIIRRIMFFVCVCGFAGSVVIASPPPQSPIDFIKICFDFRTAFCVSAKFGSYAARNMFP